MLNNEGNRVIGVDKGQSNKALQAKQGQKETPIDVWTVPSECKNAIHILHI